MSIRVVGLRPPDDMWKRYKKVYDTCIDAGVDPPEEVIEFFQLVSGGEEPDEAGVEVDIGNAITNDWNIEGCEIDITKLPKNVKIIRFYNSW